MSQSSEDRNSELAKLVVRRNRIKETLNRFAEFVDTFNLSQIKELQVRTEKIEPLLDRFEEIQIEIEILDSEADGNLEYESFESQFYSLLATAKGHISQYQLKAEHNQSLTNPSLIQNSQGSSGIDNNSFIVGGAKLPSLGLPKFRGDFEKWLQFFEGFQTLVHNNPCLDNIQKFYYLLDCLEGEARKILDCLEITNDNYEVALDLLKKRFQNKPVIIKNHIKALVDMPIVSRESSQLLRNLSDSIEKHIRALKTLGEPVDTWDRLLIFLMSKKLDIETKKEWEQKSISDFKGVPQLSNFINFLNNKCHILETVESNTKGTIKQGYSGSQNSRGAYAAVGGSNVKCEFCKGSHFVYFCQKLLALSVSERLREIKKLKLCFNCLRSSHTASECRASGCKRCRGRHNSLLHLEKQINQNFGNGRLVNKDIESGRKNKPEEADTVHACVDGVEATEEQFVAATSYSNPKEASQTILSTALIYIKDNKDNYVKCRALLDSGSQMNFISSELVRKLKLKTNTIDIPISGVNQMLTKIDSQTESIIKSCYNNFTATLSFLVLKNITYNIPVQSFEASAINIPSNLKLADPEFNMSAKIDVLIGADLFFNLLCVGQIRLGMGKPLLQKSVFGWIISGRLVHDKSSTAAQSFHLLASQDVQEQLEKFWHIEEVATASHYSKEESDCEQHFVDRVTRDCSGRFCVTLPLKDNSSKLGNSLENAKSRFYSLEKKFAKNAVLKEEYSAFIQEYIDLGHMSKIEIQNDSLNNICYLPHHGVINEGSTTTKLRVVFDASSKTSSNFSLNDVLMVGPCIQDDLFDILIRFRQHSVVLTADITKMYRQVNVDVQQRDLQRILWRADSDSELEHYRLNTLTYGTAPAAFLATRCLVQIALDIEDRLPEISKIIRKQFYVDDLILSVESVEKAIEIAKCIYEELSKYGFPLRKWSSNYREVLDGLPENILLSSLKKQIIWGIL